eukprot:6204018-Pleurochrysis_carterae.AAC.1
MPGGAACFASPICAIALASGQRVCCVPLFISSMYKGDVPVVDAGKMLVADKMKVAGVSGVVLGILSGEEQWKDKSEKVKVEFRRFALVAFEGFAPCMVQLDKMSLPSEDERSV